ncbi:hypothetical protein BDI4_830058 [Burkholderia diffusa]|nr:hypothetical protein BDI4_830058 [Burkholderia diffusa]
MMQFVDQSIVRVASDCQSNIRHSSGEPMPTMHYFMDVCHRERAQNARCRHQPNNFGWHRQFRSHQSAKYCHQPKADEGNRNGRADYA